MNRTLAALALVTVAWALVTIASLGALSQACRYGEPRELS